MTAKQKLHRLVDDLPKSELRAARRFLERLCAKPHDTGLPTRNERADREPLSLREIRNIRKSLAQIRRGQTITLEEYKRTRGL